MSYERECPRCGVMLDYVIELIDNDYIVGYWCHTPSCKYKETYKYKKDIKKLYKIFAPLNGVMILY